MCYVCLYVDFSVWIPLWGDGEVFTILERCLKTSGYVGKGQMGSALMGSLRILYCLIDIYWVLPSAYFHLPKSARAYLSPQSVKNHYFYSGPISADPICP